MANDGKPRADVPVTVLLGGVAILAACQANPAAAMAGRDGGAPPTPYSGLVVMESFAPDQCLVSAFFLSDALQNVTTGCVLQDLPTEESLLLGLPMMDGGEHALVNAGTLSVTNGSQTIDTLLPTSGSPDSGYASYSSGITSSCWAPGDALEVQSSGDVVEAVSASVTAPASPQILNPPSSGGKVSISAPLAVSWKPQGASFMVAELQLVTPGAFGPPAVLCVAPDSDGSLAVPASMLGEFGAGTIGMLTLSPCNLQDVHAANATVRVVASLSTQYSISFEP